MAAAAAAYYGGERRRGGGGLQQQQQQQKHHGLNMMMVLKKRVVVMVDNTSRAKHAMIWALSHVLNKGDLLTLLHVVAPPHGHSAKQRHMQTAASSRAQQQQQQQFVRSLGCLCKAYKPEVEVEEVVVRGPKLLTVLSQVKKLHASVLILGQKGPSPLSCLFGSSREEEFVEECINRASCLTLAVRRQSGGLGGYLVSTRWQKNFWLLA